MRDLATLALVLALAGTGCEDRVYVGPAENPGRLGGHLPPPGARPPASRFQLDLLFVIADVPSMATVQRHLVDGFSYFLQELREPLGGLPDLHIGILTGSMGAGAYTAALPGCTAPDGGNLIWQARAGDDVLCETTRIRGPSHFLEVLADGSWGNYTGRLGDAFRCLARVGTGGCPFQQPLAAVEAALGPGAPAGNQDFLRPGAFLGILFVTDQEDCSVPAGSLLFDPWQRTVDDPLGPLTTFRCLDASLRCSGQRLPRSASGPLGDCLLDDSLAATDPLHTLTPVSHFRDVLSRLEPTPSRLITAAFVPAFDRVQVAIDPDSGDPELAPSCWLPDDGSAWGPSYRLPATTRIHMPICRGYDVSLGGIGFVLGTWLLEPPNLPGPG